MSSCIAGITSHAHVLLVNVACCSTVDRIIRMKGIEVEYSRCSWVWRIHRCFATYLIEEIDTLTCMDTSGTSKNLGPDLPTLIIASWRSYSWMGVGQGWSQTGNVGADHHPVGSH